MPTGSTLADKEELIVQCNFCQQRGDHEYKACPNGDVGITMINFKFKNFQKRKARDDLRGPPKRFRVGIYEKPKLKITANWRLSACATFGSSPN